MEDKKKSRIISGVQIAVVAAYALMVVRSTVGTFMKENKKRIKKEAKRKEKLAKAKFKKKMKKVKK